MLGGRQGEPACLAVAEDVHGVGHNDRPRCVQLLRFERREFRGRAEAAACPECEADAGRLGLGLRAGPPDASLLRSCLSQRRDAGRLCRLALRGLAVCRLPSSTHSGRQWRALRLHR